MKKIVHRTTLHSSKQSYKGGLIKCYMRAMFRFGAFKLRDFCTVVCIWQRYTIYKILWRTDSRKDYLVTICSNPWIYHMQHPQEGNVSNTCMYDTFLRYLFHIQLYFDINDYLPTSTCDQFLVVNKIDLIDKINQANSIKRLIRSTLTRNQ